MNKMCKYKTFSMRLFPTKEQEQSIRELSQISTQIYNHFLGLNQKEYTTNKKMLDNYQMHKHQTVLKHTQFKKWEKLNSKASQATLDNLYSNYRSFFNLSKKDKAARPPNKKDENIFHTIIFNQCGWRFKKNGIVELNKIPIKYASHFDVKNSKIKEMRITYQNNKWIVYCISEMEIAKPQEKQIENKVLAIDLGIKTLATGIDTDGQVVIIHNKPKKVDKYFSKQIGKIQTKKAECKKDSNRYRYLANTIHKLYNRKNSQKKQYLHTQVNNILSMNHHTIILGDLQVKKLMEQETNKTKKISRSFGRSNISMFIDFLTYKAEEKAVNVIKVNEVNTTQLNCLTNKLFDKKIELKDREVQLSKEIIIDRDLNSAINIYNRWYNNHLAALTPPLDLSSVLTKNNLLSWVK